jgi:hypothetical protein
MVSQLQTIVTIRLLELGLSSIPLATHGFLAKSDHNHTKTPAHAGIFIPKNLRLQPESTFEGNAYTKAVRQDGFSNTK